MTAQQSTAVPEVHEAIMQLPPEVVLVKFYGWKGAIPHMVRRVERDALELEHRHVREGLALGLPQGGLHAMRKNRVDTAKRIYQREENVSARNILQDIKNQGYVLTDIHWYEDVKRVGEGVIKRRVLVLSFAFPKEGETLKEFDLPTHVRAALFERMRASYYGFVNVLANPKYIEPDGTVWRLDTVNFTVPLDRVDSPRALRFMGKDYALLKA